MIPLIFALAVTSTPSSALEQGKSDFDWFFAVPVEHRWSLRGGFGTQLWETAAGSTRLATTLRLSLHHHIGDWLSASAVADWSRLAESAASLETANTQILLGAGFGFSRWVSRFRFDVGVEGGALLRSATIGDDAMERDLFRVDPAIGVVFGSGISIRGHALFGLQAVLRHQPGRSHFLILLEADWLFGFVDP